MPHMNQQHAKLVAKPHLKAFRPARAIPRHYLTVAAFVEDTHNAVALLEHRQRRVHVKAAVCKCPGPCQSSVQTGRCHARGEQACARPRNLLPVLRCSRLI